MSGVRPPAVAGRFYPDDPSDCAAAVDRFVAAAVRPGGGPPMALIAPHAGYVYSGAVAATAYASLAPGPRPPRVLILGPAHTVPLRAMAVTDADAWATPLGEVEIDEELREIAGRRPRTDLDDLPHAREHGIEVHLPFLQRMFGELTFLPVVVGAVPTDDVADLIGAVWDQDDGVLVIVSTDLSHYHDYETARRLDERTAGAIARADHDAIEPGDACGVYPLRGMLRLAGARCLSIDRLDLRNSGDTAGGRDRVVGYGAFKVGATAAA